MSNVIKDIDWIKQSFLLPPGALQGDGDKIRRIYSTSFQKATDTTLGGNFILNPPAQFTRYADIKHNIRSPNDLTRGMGRWYSEVIDDNQQVVHFRCGVAEFNSLSNFYSNYYSVPAATMARTGRTADFFYKLGWALGTVGSIPLMPFIFAGKVLRFAMMKPASKYYYLRPTMYPYWHAVSSMVNGIAANMGIIPRPVPDAEQPLFDKDELAVQADYDEYHRVMPWIYRKSGGIDVFSVALQGQRLADARREVLESELRQASTYADLQKIMQKRAMGNDWRSIQRETPSLEDYAEIWRSSMALGQYNEDEAQKDSFEQVKRGQGHWAQFAEAFTNERHMGAEFVSFRVDHTGTQSESFSSTAGESSIAGQINSMSSSAREARFTFADGNVDAGEFVKTAVDAARSFAAGTLEGLNLQGLAQLAGSAFVDIPKVWQNSSCDFNRTTFTIPLRSPYGNKLSRLQNLILPMCALFAMGVPLSTGKQSYTSPFLVEVFNKGRTHIRLGLIDSLSFTRGVGDIGWTNQHEFLGVDVQVSVLDLSSVMHMPLQAGFTFTEKVVMGSGYALGTLAESMGAAQGTGAQAAALSAATLGSTYDDDNLYTDYQAILASMALEDEISRYRKWAFRLARQATKVEDMVSPQGQAIWAMSGFSGDLIKAISLGTDRQ